MPEFAKYELWLTDYTGNRLRLLSRPGEWVSFSWQHLLNDRGVYVLQLVADAGLQNSFAVDYGLELTRNYGAGWSTEYYGLHLDDEEVLESGEVDEHYWTSSGFSPEHLLDQPLLWPVAERVPPEPYYVPDDDLATYDQWWMYGPADDVLKTMVDESMGPSAATERQFADFSVQGRSSSATERSYEGRYPRLLTALQDLAGDEANVDFQVVYRPGVGFEFQTFYPYIGTDRREGHAEHPTVFSLENGNVYNPRRRINRSEQVTVAIGGWVGGGGERTITIESNAVALASSPFRRREAFSDLRDVTSLDEVAVRLRKVLADEGELLQVEFTPLQTDACRYRRDWGPFDLVTAKLWGETYDMRVVEVGGRLSGEDEETIVGRVELWTREEIAA